MMTPLIVLLLAGCVAAQIEECKVDLALGVDASGSIYGDQFGTEANWVAIKNFLVRVVEEFRIGRDQARVGAVSFASMAQVEFQLEQYDNRQDILNEIRALEHPDGGTTNTEMALRLVKDVIFNMTVPNRNRPEAEDIFFILTDGKPNPYNEQTFRAIVREVKRTIRVIGVAVGTMFDEEIMEFIDPNYIRVDDFQQLDAIVENVARRACVVVAPSERPFTPGPDVCPAPMPTYAFSAYAEMGNVIFDDGHEIEFTGVYTNLGGAYDGRSRFRCPCDGYYEFTLTLSGVQFGYAAAIMRNGEVVSPLAYLQKGDGAAMSTRAITDCRAGQHVWAQVMLTHDKNPLTPCTIDSYSLMGLTGRHISSM